jgi:CPA1 family monovalent cation:H+ antiporter
MMPVTTTTTLVILFCIATAVAVAVRRLNIPYTVALVIAGLGIGSAHVVAAPALTKELLFAVFLPGLLFEAAFHIDSAVFRNLWVAVTALAVPGVMAAIGITAVLVTVALRWLGIAPSFTWGAALVFAAIVAATDPVAVTALFRELSAPAELSVLVEAESLLNDGTSIVFLSLVLTYVAGARSSVGGLVADFVVVAGGGAAVGLAVGFVTAQVIRRVDDAMIEIALTMIAAYGSFALGEDLRVSGVIATVAAGMVCGNYGRTAMSETTHTAVELFWEYVAFALNSVVFLLIGFEVSVSALVASWREIVVAYVAVVIARAMIVFGGRLLWRPLRTRRDAAFPVSWSFVLVWGGLRGALSMVLALALAVDLPHRALIVTMTTGVVVLTLLVQGLTMAPLLRRLGIGARV